MKRPGDQLVELADEAVAAGQGGHLPGALISEVLYGAEVVAKSPFGTGSPHIPSAAEIFDAFAHPGREGLRQHLEQFFEVVAAPRARFDGTLRPGDLLVRRALGEGNLAHVAMLATGETLDARDLESAGLTPESGRHGLYAQVLELGVFPKNVQDRFARRLADESGRLDHDQMILRLRQDVAPFREEQELEEIYGPEDEWETYPTLLGAGSPFHSAFDQGRTSLIQPEELEEEFVMEEESHLQRPSSQPLLSSQACQKQLKSTSVAVVGGGLAGLMAARRLGQHGVKVSVFEARPQVGGRVLSNETFSNGRITEEGAELIGSFHTTWLTLAREPEYGLSMVSRMDKDLYAREGLDVKLTLDRPLSMDEIKKLDKDMETRVLEPIARLASQIQAPSEPWLDPRLKQYDSMSVADALANLYGVKRNERLWKAIEFKLVNDEVAPLDEMNFLGLLCKVKGGQGQRLNGTDKPDDKPNLMGYWEELEIFRCADGCQKLAKGIANEIKTKYGAKLLLSRVVTHIDLSKQRVVLGSKEVISGKLADGPPLFTHYDYVVLAIPPSVWADVKITADGKDAHPKDKIGLMGMNPAVKFFSDVKERFWIKEKAAPSGGSLTLGQVWEGTDNQTRVGNQGIVLSVFAGPIIPIPLVPGGTGRRAPMPDEFQKELRNLYPGYTRNLNKILFSNWPGVPFIKTGYASPRKGEIFTIAQELNKPFLDRLFFAGEHTQMDFFGYMEGALRSGERAAEKLMLQSCGLLQQPASPSPPVRIASAAPIREKTAFE